MTSLALAIPEHESDEFSALPSKWRQEVMACMVVIADVLQGRCTKQEAAARLGVSLPTIHRKVSAARHKGWKGLVPKYKGPSAPPPAFIDYFVALVEEYQRSSRAAFRELTERWMLRKPIPGYAKHPGWPNLPRGWSERNLYELVRKHTSKLELAAMRNGKGRALALHAPKNFSTRVGLWPFSHLFFDDVDGDNFVHLLDKKQLCRVSEVGVMDALSGDRFAYGMRPQLKRADGTTDKIKESNMRFLLAHVLNNFGYSPRGTELVVEHGTATIRPDIAKLLSDRTGGKVTVRLSGMTGKEQAVAGMFIGRGGGNPRHKAPLESHHSLMHNEKAALAAQTGKDVDHRPEELHGLLRRAAALLKAGDLNPEILELLKFPTLEYYSQYRPAVAAIYERIARRTWHELEGWARLGFVTADYRLTPDSNEWMSREQFLALPEPAQLALSAVVQADLRCQRPRKLSPREVFVMGLPTLIKPPVGLIAELLHADLAAPRTCRDGYFLVEDTEVEPEPMRFESRIVKANGDEEELRDRETYEVLVNPFDTSVLWVYGTDGAFLGLAQRDTAPTRGVDAARRAAWGRKEKRIKELLAPLGKRHKALTDRRAQEAEHNADLVEHGTPEARAQARAIKRNFTGSAEALLDEKSPDPVAAGSGPTDNPEVSSFNAEDLL